MEARIQRARAARGIRGVNEQGRNSDFLVFWWVGEWYDRAAGEPAFIFFGSRSIMWNWSRKPANVCAEPRESAYLIPGLAIHKLGGEPFFRESSSSWTMTRFAKVIPIR